MKSHVSDYLKVATAIYKDAAAKCVTRVSFRDLKTIRSRVEKQGVSFLTITLPSFCKDFEKSLDRGFIDPSDFKYFRKSGAIPAFLQDMLGQLFDCETGRIFDNASSPPSVISIVDSVRQICLAFKKINLPCSPERERRAVENFVEIENSFNEFTLPQEDTRAFALVSSMLWDNLTRTIKPSGYDPRHGPGSTADKRLGNQKYQWLRWHDRLEPYFPSLESCYPYSVGELDESDQELRKLDIVLESDEQPVKVVTVPKTLKGPRVIAIEPCCMQYTQQGLRRVLYTSIESYWLTRGHINFRDQSVNQSLAMSSSTNGQLATIDLSDASDRVPLSLSLEMFNGNPSLKGAIASCRSTSAKLPSGAIIGPLRKFASMGSALCFPVEAMYFYTLCVMALLRDNSLPITYRNIYNVSRDIYVYGDDIIVPSHSVTTVLETLRKYNCRANSGKTFYRGSFRESCGVDAFLGESVTPIYLGTAPPKNRQQASEIISWLSSANHFQKKGYFGTAQLLFNYIEKLLGSLPQVSEKSPALGRVHDWYFRPPTRWNEEIQTLEVRVWTTKSVYRTDVLDGHAALTKSLMRLDDSKGRQEPDNSFSFGFEIPYSRDPSDARHLERSALSDVVALKRRWVSAHMLTTG